MITAWKSQNVTCATNFTWAETDTKCLVVHLWHVTSWSVKQCKSRRDPQMSVTNWLWLSNTNQFHGFETRSFKWSNSLRHFEQTGMTSLTTISSAISVTHNLGSIEPQGFGESGSGVRRFGSPHSYASWSHACLAIVSTNTVNSYVHIFWT